MASHRQLDAPSRPSICCSLICYLAGVLLVFSVPALSAESQSVALDVGHIEQLFQQERWQEIVNAVAHAGESADINFYYGTALARLERWPEATAAFRAGLRVAPHDPRFPIELAGVAFKQKKYAEAEGWLRRALRLSPNDTYTNDFLGTVFFIEGNLDAALKYWNRVGKPHIDSVSSDPPPRINPILLDRSFVFSPASTLQLNDLRASEARLDQLDVFPTFRFELQARDDGTFDLVFRNLERHGCGSNKWECLLLILGGTPARTLNFDYFNVHGDAINFKSLYRWDPEKRRLLAGIETPLFRTPKWHVSAGVDLRNENWAIRNSFTGPAPLLGALNLKREAVQLQFADVMSGRWHWSTGTEFSERSYHNVLAENLLTSQLLTGGAQLKQSFAIGAELLRLPERRLTIDSMATADIARLWSGGGRDFAQLHGSVQLHWFPQHTGDKYEIQHTMRAGKTFGDPSFDELFMLGVLGDSELLMRAHIATRDGKKGSAPLGRDYFLSNWEGTRNVSPISFLKVNVGPFVDTGRINDPVSALGSQKWLWDVGAQAKVKIFGFGVTVAYGRDLRSGRNAVTALAR
jgi:tetratricopeptide (TPR) repeat protein